MIPFPNKKYNVVYADPPWNVSSFSRIVRPQQKPHPYLKMKFEDIKHLPVNELMDDWCMLFLWTTHKWLPKAFEVIDSWGFSYHCTLTWNKTYGFTPFSFMWSTEFCLFGQKKNAWKRPNKYGIKTLVTEKPRKHSQKPEAMYELIECFAGDVSKIELFARNRRKGWDVWGDEIPEEEEDD